MDQTNTIDTKPRGWSRFSPRAIQSRITNAKSSYLALCFMIPVVMMYLLYLAMEIHPFGDGSVLVLDLNAQYVYFFEALRDSVHGDSSLLYSFSRALGGEFVGIYAYYIASPLSYIVALFPREMMLESLLTLFLLKCGLCGLTFGFYLHKNSKTTNKVMVIAFSTMYALSAYAIVHQHNTMWIDALIWLPLLTYGIEQLVKFGKFKLFVVALALTVWSNFYIGYMVCIYVAAYFFYYSLAYGDGRNNPRGERAHFLRSLIRIAFFSAIAVAISAFIIFGAYYALGFGKSDFTNPNWALTIKFDFLDFFAKFLPGGYDTVRPEGLPMVYTGILTLVLVPIYFMSKKFSSREKIASLAFICFFVISFMASTLDLIWHGFQNPNWLNYRYSFMLCFFLLVLAYKAFGNLREASEKFVLAICAFIILFVAVAQKQELKTFLTSDKKLLSLECVWLAILATVIIMALLCLLIRTKQVRRRENIAGILVAVVCIEIFCNGLVCMLQLDDDVVYSGYSGYNNSLEDMRELTDVIDEEDTSFYRMEKVPIRAVNENMGLGIKGISNSTSTLNADTIEFLNKLGYASSSHWSEYKGVNPVSDSLIGIKYVIDTKTAKSPALYYSAAYSSAKHSAYLNPYALSLAYGVEDGVNDFVMTDYKSHFERLNALISTMIGEEIEIYKPLPIENVSLKDCDRSSTAGHYHYTGTIEGSPASVTFTFTAPMEKCEIFFYAPSDYTREANLNLNGSDIGKYFTSSTNRIISLGVHEPVKGVDGEYITAKKMNLKITLEGKEMYLLQDCEYFYTIDREAFEYAFEKLQSNPQLVIDEGYTDDHMTGKITTSEQDQMILTTIPYDKGWKLTVDGKPTEIYETLDALIAFDVEDAGEHSIELRYMPKIYKISFTISVIGLVLFVLLCIIDIFFKPLFRKIFKLEAPSNEDILWTLDDFDADAEELAALPPIPKKSLKEQILSIKDKLFSKKSSTSGVQEKTDSTEGVENEETTDENNDGGN